MTDTELRFLSVLQCISSGVDKLVKQKENPLIVVKPESDALRRRFERALEVLRWYADCHRPETRIDDNGDKATALLQQLAVEMMYEDPSPYDRTKV